jgi:hypothetical protein
MVVDLLRSRGALEAEIMTLRKQISVLRRTTLEKLSFGAIERLVFVGLYRLFPKVGDREAGHQCSLASRGLPVVMALEVETSWWPADLERCRPSVLGGVMTCRSFNALP